jgi:predicted Zn-ribbon and HTH transcriptional regulator
MIGAPCPHCDHPNYYDKRVQCQEEEGYREIQRAGKTLSMMAVTCEECGEGFKIEDVDCEGYR